MAAIERRGCGMTAALLFATFLGLACAPTSHATSMDSVVSKERTRRQVTEGPTLGAPDVGLNQQCILYSQVSLTNVQDTITTRYDVFCLGWKFIGGVVTVDTYSNGTVVTPNGVDIQPVALQTFVPTLNAVVSVSESDAFGIVAQLFDISPGNFTLNAADQVIERIWYYDGTNVVAAYFVLFTYGMPGNSDFCQPTAVVDLVTGQVKIYWDGVNGVGQEFIPGIGGNFVYGIYDTYAWAYNYGTTFCFTDSVVNYQINNYQGTLSPVNMPFCGPLTAITDTSSSVLRVNSAFYYAPLVDTAFMAKMTNDAFKYMLSVGFKGRFTMLINIHVNYGGLDGAVTNALTGEVFIGVGTTRFYPVATCNDVVAHELAHVFTASYSNLPNKGQGGAMNEAFSDAAAEAVEFYVTGTADYKFAVSCLKDRTVVAARYLCTPQLDGGITSVSQYVSGMDIYKASGVYRKAFCLAAQCTTASIGVLAAFKTFARANMLYWNLNSNFNSGACGVRRAAVALFTQPAQISCFVSAFAAVGITVPSTCV